jgi:hypothetical protein
MPIRHIMCVKLVAYQISCMADIYNRKLTDYCMDMKEWWINNKYNIFKK